MTVEDLQHIQQVQLDAARYCQDCKLIHNNGNECPNCTRGSQESVAQLMHREEQGKWISVKDSLPNTPKLVFVHGGVAYCNDGKWFTITGETWPGRIIQWPVTHWMPLPDPPESA